MPGRSRAPDHGSHQAPTPASYAACVRLVADAVDAQTLVNSIARGPLHQLGVLQAALYIPTTVAATRGPTTLTLLGQYCIPGLEAPPGALTLTVPHPACAAFTTHEVVDRRLDDADSAFPLLTRYSEQLDALAYESTQCRFIALPIDIQAVTQGVLTLLVSGGPDAWSWPEVELLRGAASLLAVWLRLTQLTNLVEASGMLRPQPGANVHLTERQHTILQALRDGKSNTSIATSLGFSISTVKQDISALQKMLGARNRHEVVRRAFAAGLLTPS